MQLGLKNAVDVPFSLAEKVNSLWPFLKEMAQHGNIACKSDIQVFVLPSLRTELIFSCATNYFIELNSCHKLVDAIVDCMKLVGSIPPGHRPLFSCY